MVQTTVKAQPSVIGFDLKKTVLSLLPSRISECITKSCDLEKLCEIRLRRERPISLTCDSNNILCDKVCSASELDYIVYRMCRGSIHSYGDHILNGYIPLDGGCRVGVCGKAVTDKGRLISIKEITSLNIRIPRCIKGVGDELVRYLAQSQFSKSVLIYSPPGVGKTTLISDAAASLSSTPYLKRVALIDCRCELYREESFKNSIVDVYSSYPKAEAIEKAVRTMSPQLIICDEIGKDEAEAIIGIQNTGVPMIATAHAHSVSSLLKRPAFAFMHKACVFDDYIGITRSKGDFELTVISRDMADIAEMV